MVVLTELRSHRRSKTLLSVNVRNAHKPVRGEVNLIDISLTGAGFESCLNFGMGDRIVIDFGSIYVEGVIRRVSMEGFKQYFYGIEFDMLKNNKLRRLQSFLASLPDIATYC